MSNFTKKWNIAALHRFCWTLSDRSPLQTYIPFPIWTATAVRSNVLPTDRMYQVIQLFDDSIRLFDIFPLDQTDCDNPTKEKEKQSVDAQLPFGINDRKNHKRDVPS